MRTITLICLILCSGYSFAQTQSVNTENSKPAVVKKAVPPFYPKMSNGEVLDKMSSDEMFKNQVYRDLFNMSDVNRKREYEELLKKKNEDIYRGYKEYTKAEK